jgi:hypothetical protein
MTIGDANATNNEYCGTYSCTAPANSIEEINIANHTYLANASLVYELNTNEPINFAVYNTSGQLVKSETSTNANSSLDFSNLNDGVYFITVQAGNESFTKKVAKF